MKSLPSRRFSRFGVSRSAGRTSAASVAAGDSAVSASLSTVVALPTSIADDGVDASTITVTALNAEGLPLSGFTVTPSSTGSSNTFTPTSAVTDSNGEATFSFTSTAQATKTISAVAGGVSITDTASVTVSASGAPAALFGADFSHGGLGTSTTAIGDNARFDTFGGSGLEVIASTGLDFPSGMDEVLRVTANSTHAGFALARKTGMTVPAVGVTRFYRAYWRPTFPDGLEDNQVHPVQDGQAGSMINWEWSVYQTSNPRTGSAITAGYYVHSFQMHTNNDFNTAFRFTPPELAKNATYRVEWAVARLTTTTFNLHVRIYNSAGTLILSDADFLSQNGAVSLADDPELLFNAVANLDGLNVGLNGIGGSAPPFPFVHSYQGGFITNDTDWCGAYIAGESD